MAQTIDTKLGGAVSAAVKPLRAIEIVRRFCSKLLRMIAIFHERAEQRRALGELGDRMLKDIGVSEADAYKEIRKPFWLP